jgi:hypothetical protein
MDKSADKSAPQNQNPQNPKQAQNPQRNPGQGQGQKPSDPSQHDPSQRDKQGNPQDRYASGTDRARDVPVDRKGGQEKPGAGRDNERGNKN